MRENTSRRMAASAVWALLVCFTLVSSIHAFGYSISNMSPSFGAPGITISIYGNFPSTVGKVKFVTGSGTVLVAATTWSTTVITVKVPTNAATGLVTVTNSLGQSWAQSTGDFDVVAAGTSLVLGAFPPSGSSCTYKTHSTTQNGGQITTSDTTLSNCLSDYQTLVLPNIDGVTIVVPWSDVDTGTTGPNYTGWTSGKNVDGIIEQYTTGPNWGPDKKVGIVLAPVSNGGNNMATPSYVFTQGWAGSGNPPLDECTCQGYQGGSGALSNQCWTTLTHSDTSGFPAVWEQPFQTALKDFYSNAVSHFNSASYSKYIAYVRMGLSGGGEEFPYCSTNLETLNGVPNHNAAGLETVWTGYAASMASYQAGLSSQLPLMAAGNGNGTANGVPSDDWADKEAHSAINNGLAWGSEGLQFQDTIGTNPCSNDWCNTFTFTSQTSIPTSPVRELQTLGYSDPPENNCSSGNYNGPFAVGTASLVCVLPFGQQFANSLELYPEDLFQAFDSNYYDQVTYTFNNTPGTDYNTPYAHAICTARGVPLSSCP